MLDFCQQIELHEWKYAVPSLSTYPVSTLWQLDTYIGTLPAQLQREPSKLYLNDRLKNASIFTRQLSRLQIENRWKNSIKIYSTRPTQTSKFENDEGLNQTSKRT